MAEEAGLDVLGRVPEDAALAEYDALGEPILDLPETSPSVAAVREILRKMGFSRAVGRGAS
jgi:CO dehydrogenase nickel-insertion accessory protein CooC1